MRTTTKLIRSDFTASSLRDKLQMCGSRTNNGHWYWCRSPSCDRCRRFRARIIADAVSDWALTETGHRLNKIRTETGSYSDPQSLLEGIRDLRQHLRGVFDRRQRQDDRWASARCYGFFSPAYSDGTWKAQYNGVIHLGRVHPITFEDAFKGSIQVRLTEFPKIVLKPDVYAWAHYSVANVRGLQQCPSSALSTYFNEVDRRAGFKAVVFRRGFQA